MKERRVLFGARVMGFISGVRVRDHRSGSIMAVMVDRVSTKLSVCFGCIGQYNPAMKFYFVTTSPEGAPAEQSCVQGPFGRYPKASAWLI